MALSNRKIWFAVISIFVVLAAYGFLHSPLFQINNIEIQGNSLISREDLLALANAGTGMNIFQLSTVAILKNVALHPLVKSVEVQRKFPDTLIIKVKERKPLAMVPVQNGFALVDEEGLFLQRSDTWPKEAMPVISGIKVPENLNLGQPVDNPGLLEGIKILKELPKDLYPMIGELFSGNQDKLVLYTRDGLEIRLGVSDQASQKFAVMQKFLTDKNYTPYRIGYYVDLTSGKPVLGKR